MNEAALEVCRVLARGENEKLRENNQKERAIEELCSVHEKITLPNDDMRNSGMVDSSSSSSSSSSLSMSFPAPALKFWRESLKSPESTLSKLAGRKSSSSETVSSASSSESVSSAASPSAEEQSYTSPSYAYPPWHPLASGEGRAHLEIALKYRVKFKCIAGPCSSPRNRDGCSDWDRDGNGLIGPVFVVLDYDPDARWRAAALQGGAHQGGQVTEQESGAENTQNDKFLSSYDHGFDFTFEEVLEFKERNTVCQEVVQADDKHRISVEMHRGNA